MALQSFAVVDFIKQVPREVEVVHSDWIHQFKGLEENCMVKWPPCSSDEKLRRMVLRAEPATESWKGYEVRILYTTDDYSKARRKCSRAMDTSDLNTTDDDLGPPRKRVHKPNPRFLESHSEDDDDDDSDDDSDYSNVASTSSDVLTKRQRKGAGPKTPPPISRPNQLKQFNATGSRQQSPRESLHLSRSPFGSLNGVSPRSSTTTMRPTLVQSLSQREVLIKVEELKLEVKENRKILKAILAKLEEKGQEESLMSIDQSLPDDLSFPVDSAEDLDCLEERLQQSRDLRYKLIVFFSMSGAQHLRSSVSRIMETMITRPLGGTFNWCGQRSGGKIGFYGRYPNIVKLVCDAVRKNPHLRDTNDGMVHKEIQRFLKYVLQKLQKKKAQTAEIPENHEATD